MHSNAPSMPVIIALKAYGCNALSGVGDGPSGGGAAAYTIL